MEIRKTMLGPKHPNTLASIRNLLHMWKKHAGLIVVVVLSILDLAGLTTCSAM